MNKVKNYKSMIEDENQKRIFQELAEGDSMEQFVRSKMLEVQQLVSLEQELTVSCSEGIKTGFGCSSLNDLLKYSAAQLEIRRVSIMYFKTHDRVSDDLPSKNYPEFNKQIIRFKLDAGGDGYARTQNLINILGNIRDGNPPLAFASTLVPDLFVVNQVLTI